MTGPLFDRLLIANRGEIACRIARTCRRLGITTVAIVSDADRHEPHATAADEVVCIGPTPAAASYLDIDAILRAARDHDVDAIHPGYGFLAESPAFAAAVAEARITFVGPSPDVIRLMGDKAAAKRHLGAAGVPLIAGTHDRELDDAGLIDAAAAIGVPLLVKAVAGGGGKGMRAVADLAELPAAVASARREAAAAFGDDRLMLERLIARPRHIEVQIMADSHGSVLHLLERECSIQRRHQKVLEECPSPAVDAALRAHLTDAAVTAARAVDYRGAGTIEFLVDADTLSSTGDGDGAQPTFAFLEMNTRLQVEHPVTELVTGLDLVELQLLAAAGEPLGITQHDVTATGHAIEVRLYAENPVTHLPQTGTVLRLDVPDVPWLRLDTGVDVGSRVTPHYDPMLAKLIVHGPDRATACDRLSVALSTTTLHGVVTNLELLAAIAGTKTFRDGDLTTGFLTEHLADWSPPAVPDAALAAAARAVLACPPSAATDPFVTSGPLRLGSGGTPVTLSDGDVEHHVVVSRRAGSDIEVRRDGDRLPPATPDGLPPLTTVEPGGQTVWVHVPGVTRGLTVVPETRHRDPAALTGDAALTAPMPGCVLAVPIAAGDVVTAGTTLVVVEAMKMEHPVTAPADGRVRDVHVRTGDRVDAGTPLISFTTEPT